MTLQIPALRVGRGERTLIRTPPLLLGPGDRVVLLGPSGSGKTTLLACLAGLTRDHVEAWCVDDAGRPFHGFPESCALVPQNPYTAFFAPTVEREIAFPLENRGEPVRTLHARVEDALRWAEIEHLRFRAGPTLSGGEAQRVHLAVAWARRPELFLLDEPLAYLDGPAAKAFVEKLTTVDRAVLVVDHDPEPWRNWATAWWRIEEDGLLSISYHPPEPFEIDVLPEELPNTDVLLTVQQLWARYASGPWVFRNLSLTLHRGETLTVVGPSGCGKTTLFRVLTGQLRPQRGQLVWTERTGRQRTCLALPRTEAIYVPQNPEHFFWRPTVRAEAEEDEALPALTRFGLDHALDSSPFRLSSGEQRRLTLACSLGKERRIVLLDEPSFGLDRKSYRHLFEDLRTLQRQGRTILLITHREDLARVGHRRVDLRRGADHAD